MKKNELIERLKNAEFPSEDSRLAAINIVEYICSVSHFQILEHIFYHRLCEKTNSTPEAIFRAISTLLGNNLPILDVKFEFIEFDDSEPIEIPNEDIFEASITNSFIHPITGIPVVSFKNKIFMYFSLSEFGKEIFCD